MKPVFLILAAITLIGTPQRAAVGAEPYTLGWTQGKCLECESQGLGHIQFASRNDAFAIGYRYAPGAAQGTFTLVFTHDAGRTWRETPRARQYGSDPDGPTVFSLIDPEHGWASWLNVGTDETQLIVTRDGGKSWSDIPQPPHLDQILFFDQRHGYGRGHGFGGDEFYRTDDGGNTWSGELIPHLTYLSGFLFLTRRVGWISGAMGTLLKTEDGGRHWNELRGSGLKGSFAVSDLFFLDGNRGWAVGRRRKGFDSHLLSTVDGGTHWTVDPDPSFQGSQMQAGVVRFVSEQRGFVLSVDRNQHGNLVYTTDGGAHWSKRLLPYVVEDCQLFEGDLLCSASNNGKGFITMMLHPSP